MRISGRFPEDNLFLKTWIKFKRAEEQDGPSRMDRDVFDRLPSNVLERERAAEKPLQIAVGGGELSRLRPLASSVWFKISVVTGGATLSDAAVRHVTLRTERWPGWTQTGGITWFVQKQRCHLGEHCVGRLLWERHVHCLLRDLNGALFPAASCCVNASIQLDKESSVYLI